VPAFDDWPHLPMSGCQRWFRSLPAAERTELADRGIVEMRKTCGGF
jgi:hypothetical protein